jgi:hypothetical protein
MGSLDAKYNLGVCYRRGLGVARNDSEAERLYRAAAERGHRSAQLALASMREQSATSEADWVEALHWYRLAADAGHPAALLSLAQLYERGRGVAADRREALVLYRQALAAGAADAEPAVLRIEAELKSPQYVA